MKVIFLNPEGALNCDNTLPFCNDYMGIDKDKVERLKEIVDATGAKIVLISPWKDGWMPGRQYQPNRYPFAAYLDDNLLKYGNLTIFDKTHEMVASDRGMGIKAWIEMYPDITHWIVLDNRQAKDYIKFKIVPDHLILTDCDLGLTPENVAAAISLLT